MAGVIAAMNAGLRHRPRETADDYPHVDARHGDDLRIIRCPDDLQFIAQRRTSDRGVTRWASVCFFVTVAGARALTDQHYARLAPLAPAAVALFAPQTPQSANVVETTPSDDPRVPEDGGDDLRMPEDGEAA